MNNKRKIIWSFKSKESLDNIYEHIKNDSLQNAQKVKHKIIEIVNDLLVFPEKYPRELFLDKSKGKHPYKSFYLFSIELTF